MATFQSASLYVVVWLYAQHIAAQDHRPIASKYTQGDTVETEDDTVYTMSAPVSTAERTTDQFVSVTSSEPTTSTAKSIEYEPFRDEHNPHLVGLKVRGSDYERPCLLAQMDGRFVVKSLADYSPFIENWPEYALVGGHCAESKHHDALLTLTWDTQGARFTLALTWEASYQRNPIKKNYEWRSAIIKAVFTFTPPYGPDIVAENQSPTPVVSPYVQAFYCRNSINITVVSMKDEVEATIQFSAPVKLQAYGVEEIGGFGSAYLCERTRRLARENSLRSKNTLRAFVAYVVVMLAIFAGYCAKRRFKPEQKTDYDELDE